MKKKLTKAQLVSLTFITILSVCTAANAQVLSYSNAMRLEKHGEFRKASTMMKAILKRDAGRISAKQTEKIRFEIERMRRIRIDYSLNAAELFSQLQQGIRGITRREFEDWQREGKFDSRIINDTLRFVNASRSNLFFRYPAIAARRIPPVDETEHYAFILQNCLAVERAADSLKSNYVFPTRLQLRMTDTLDSGAVKTGQTVKAWLPIPRRLPYQGDFSLLSSSSKPISVAASNSPIRSIFMEQRANDNGQTNFSIKYAYRTFAVHFTLDAKKVQAYDKSDGTYRKFTRQSANVEFTKKIRNLSRTIVGSEINPLIKAERIYDWIAHNIVYSFAREYSTIRNIGNYCLTKRYGDCGQEAMLFITLCRYNGIPARWQSGWFFIPGGKDIHDWTQIYIRPYGWIPVDPYMGILATRYMTSLRPEQRRTVREFYFGGLDQFRMSANSDNNQVLDPPKKFFRSDNVDFQRGEIETDSANVYFNEFNYNLDVEKIEAVSAK